jgi:hypothetical protein
MGQSKEMMTTIKINGKDVPVDAAFNDLTPEQQEMEKKYIAEQIAKGITFGGGEPVVEKEPTTIAGLPISAAPEAGAVIGSTMGAAIGPAVGEVLDKSIATGANAIRPTPGNASPNAPQSVRNWLATQTSTPYAGGRDYEEAARKANIAGSKPVQSRGSTQGIRRGGLGIDVQPEPPTLPQKAAANILNAERMPKPGITRRVAGMGVAGAELGNMAKEFDEGNYGRAALSGVGTAGGIMSQSRIKPVRALGTGLSVAVPAIQKFLLKDKDEDQSNIQEKAMGGSVTPSPKLKSLSDFLDQLMQQAAAPTPAPAPAAPQGGMPPGMPGVPPQQPPMQQPPTQQSPLNAMMPQMAAGGLVHLAKGKLVKKGLELSKKFNYDPYKMSQQYPDVIPPVLAIDPKTGKEFFQKQLSPEALEVQKARKAAQKQIDAGNYTPFFDESKRFYADPSHYPTAGYTATDAVPKKAETIAKYEALANDPKSLERLRAAYQRGSDKPDAKDWYAMGQLEEAFIRELGPEEGRRQFKNRFADAMAATTGGADPNSNLMMAAFTNYQKGLGQEIPTKAADLPFPIGGRFVSGNMEQARKLADVGEISAVTNPKRHNFSANFLGHRDVSTLDEQMSQLWDPKMMAPPTNAYGIYQQALAKEAKKAGVQPANFQDVAWAGAKDYQGKPMIREINEMIERTHAITGESKDEILKGFIRGNKPMYGIGAGSVGGLGALQEENQ